MNLSPQAFILVPLFLSVSCRPVGNEFLCGGPSMGTTWSLRTLGSAPDQAQVQRELDALESVFSTWRADSEISRFNQTPPHQWFPVSAELSEAFLLAREVHDRSSGAFDPTVGPLTAAFGFGPPSLANPGAQPCLELIDYDPCRPALRKKTSAPTLDLSALAEGFALERIASRLLAAGHHNFLLELGGELLARGDGPTGGGWRVGIQDPGIVGKSAATSLSLRNEALATSGTYRQREQRKEGTVTHIIDPRTRRPVAHDTVSVSVIAPSAIQADAWATALLVLGAEEGREMAGKAGLEALFLKASPEKVD
ncbi:MAG: FAD:protein FMN transferase [Verrucomicrobia bacterium]|nr:FAD:protein FMN transferase [Verrucomicrobiota bacterium]